MKSIELAESFGYMTAAEVMALKELASEFGDDDIIVNVGAGAGASGVALAEALPNAKRYTVDISPGGSLGGLLNERNAFEGTDLPLPIFILGASHEVGAEWEEGEISLVFVDDGHEYHEIVGDIQAWLPHVKNGGIVVFHDFGSNEWPAVKGVVMNRMKSHFCIKLVDTLAAFRIVK